MKRYFTLIALGCMLLGLMLASVVRAAAIDRRPLAHEFLNGCGAPVDLLFVLDISGSMNDRYGMGMQNSKLQAAKQAMVEVNQFLDQQGNGSRAGLITFHGSQGYGWPPFYPTDVDLRAGFTTNFAALDNVVMGLHASGSTPTAEALDLVTSWLPTNIDPNNMPLVVLISDGVPTVSRQHHGFADQHVEAVNIYDPAGDPYAPGQVYNAGAPSPDYPGEHAGQTMADTMWAIGDLKEALPLVAVHTIYLQDASDQVLFENDQIMQYVAEAGDGTFHSADNLAAFMAALNEIVGGNCPTPTPGPTNPPPCDSTPVDLLYVLDISGSMNFAYGAQGSKLSAAKEAIVTTNNLLAQQNNGSRGSLITFHGGQSWGMPPHFPTDVSVQAPFMSNFAALNSAVTSLYASGTTPTSVALDVTTSWLPSQLDSNHMPLIVVISDGVPTVTRNNHGYQDSQVELVNIYDPAGNAYTPGQVAGMGAPSNYYQGEHAGQTLADTMWAIGDLKAVLPEAQVHTIFLQDGGHMFENAQIMQYVAQIGGGSFHSANDLSAFIAALTGIIGGGTCPTPTPPPAPTSTPLPPPPTATTTPPPPPPPTATATPPPDLCQLPTEVILWAGQNNNVGSVTVWNDADTLYVNYHTTGGWLMPKTHLAVATTIDGIPQNSGGNPQIGQFPYQSTHEPPVDDVLWVIPLAENGWEPGNELYIAAHAEVIWLDGNGNPIAKETGWGDGNPFPGSSWAMWFNFIVTPCDPPPVAGINPGDFRTQTQGGWGTAANGNNPGVYRDANFALAYPNGLMIGAANSALFTSSTAVQIFLPQGGTASYLGQDYLDPIDTDAGVLGGQVTALSLNVGFDLYDDDFGASPIHLADLIVVDATSACYGMTVQGVLDEANLVTGEAFAFGQQLAPYQSLLTPSEVNECASAINENFVDGIMVGDYLGLP